jgi:hypothetical protein
MKRMNFPKLDTLSYAFRKKKLRQRSKLQPSMMIKNLQEKQKVADALQKQTEATTTGTAETSKANYCPSILGEV